ncbi:MAG TPA: hypothetical protein VMN78_07125 [Longimicrobiales bacterium]|nr:hypothetical protein [Longimicrobiales bacterium]
MTLTLHRLHLGYRILYTGVLLFMTAGTVVHTVHQAERGGLAPSAVADWYRGNEDDADAVVYLFPKSLEEVWADVWLHSTTYAIAFVVLGSLLFRSGIGRSLQAGLLAGFAGLGLCATAAPLLVRYASAGFAWLLSVPLLVLPAVATAIFVITAGEMWFWRTAGMRYEPRIGG